MLKSYKDFNITSLPAKTFATKVLHWFDRHGRKDLPWQHNPTPYRVWISEIMLQQTQVATVIPYFKRFMDSFPDVITLANATEDSVLQHWAGLGYYSRARNLHKAAQRIRDEYQGIFPEELEALETLAGIGRSTAGAILSLACHQKQAILDGNVKRVLTRYHAIEGWTGKTQIQKQLWELAERHLPNARNADYTQAMMDLGATVCKRSTPACDVCPLVSECTAYAEGNPQHYPTPKPKKKIPERQVIMLLVQNPAGECFLQKRPPTGIWGSLWSLPQFESTNAAREWYESFFADEMIVACKPEPFTHVFSHFRLHISPLQIQQKTTTKRVMEANAYLWYNRQHEFMGGLPAPIQKLLERTLT
jgi:A/G-specific adenine glycosylase